MAESLRVASPPDKPLLVFDGDCRFCRFWIARWRHHTGDAVEYHPFQNPQIASRFPELPRERFARAVQLIEPDGTVSEGAHAMVRALARARRRMPLWVYQRVPGVARLTEGLYRFIAAHRSLAWRVTSIVWGRRIEKETEN